MNTPLFLHGNHSAKEVLTLLLVDDDLEDLFFLKRLLAKSGRRHSVIEARSVEQAVQQLQQMPDVVLLDYNLGGETGFDFLGQMQQAGCQLPVIMLTGLESDDLDQQALEQGVADFLLKSIVNPVTLDRSIRFAYRDFIRLQQLEYLAHFDTLTGLCNRRLFMDRLGHALDVIKRNDTTGAVLYIDIDGFKEINDEQGHAVGDELLAAVAQRMRETVRSSDTVARLGGDEFVILLENVSAAEAHLVAQKLLVAMESPLLLKQQQIHCSLSIGLCVFGANATSSDEILTSADRALYQAKAIGKHTYCSFNRNLMEALSRRMLIEQMAQDSVVRGDFYLCFQPRVCSQTLRVVGFETLARWPQRNGLQLSPADFIPVLKSMGLMDDFTRWVIDKALSDYQRLRQLVPGCHLSINVSPSNFVSGHLQQYLVDQVASLQIDPAVIEIEVTESVFIERPDAAIGILDAWRRAGMRVALDDFGTGYSSLSYLSQLPIDTIKLDRNFLQDVPGSERSSLLVAAIVDLACKLNLNVVAEGVENHDQMQFLQRCGCHELQGFLTGRPMTLEQLVQLSGVISRP
ncbi:MAG: EAL domain-containing protein [Gammaproteobacteria bacterium]